MQRRQWLKAPTAGALLALLLAAGCSTVDTLSVEVSTFGTWPAGRAPGSYAFERLPSQEAQGERMTALEAAAAPALAKAGFTPAPAGAQPDVLVQLGARVSRTDASVWDDPMWWHGGFGLRRHGPWRGTVWGGSLRMDPPRYDREVAVLVRDRTTGAPLFEARGSSEGYNSSAGPVLQSLFAGALMDFPRPGINPRTVQVIRQP